MAGGGRGGWLVAADLLVFVRMCMAAPIVRVVHSRGVGQLV